MAQVLILFLIVMLVGSFPVFPYSRGWGYNPAGSIGALLGLVVVLLFFNVI